MIKFIKFSDMQGMIAGLSRSTVWRLERQGLFPKRRLLTTRTVVWNKNEVIDWVNSRVQSGAPVPGSRCGTHVSDSAE